MGPRWSWRRWHFARWRWVEAFAFAVSLPITFDESSIVSAECFAPEYLPAQHVATDDTSFDWHTTFRGHASLNRYSPNHSSLDWYTPDHTPVDRHPADTRSGGQLSRSETQYGAAAIHWAETDNATRCRSRRRRSGRSGRRRGIRLPKST